MNTTYWTCQECGGYADDDGGYLVCINCGFLAKQGYHQGAVSVEALRKQVARFRLQALEMAAEEEESAA